MIALEVVCLKLEKSVLFVFLSSQKIGTCIILIRLIFTDLYFSTKSVIVRNFYDMKYSIIFIIALLSFSYCANSQSENQNDYKRVRKAYTDKEDFVKELLLENGIKNYEYDLLITAYKSEQFLQLWCKSKDSTTYKSLIKYDFCTSSGVL